jgi:hypothetical protein
MTYQVLPSMAQLRELGKLVGRSEQATSDPKTIETLGEALDFALSILPGWTDSLITQEDEA